MGGGVESNFTEIYIDGSSHDSGAGWSVVIVSPDQHGLARFQGCIYGYVNTNDVAPTWIGASAASNIDAELQAMIVAQMFVLARDDFGRVVIRPDLQFSHHLAALKVGSKTDSALPAIVAALGSIVTQKVEVVEVRGHTGNPWNELADGLANYAANCKLNGGTFPVKALQHLAKNKLRSEWLWWSSGSDHHKAAIPSFGCQGEWSVTPSKTNIQIVPLSDTQHERADIIAIKVATINTCSVRDVDPSTGKPKGARATRLDQQMHSARIALAGLQETRMPRTTCHYNIYASGPQKCGKSLHYGTEIWVSKAIAGQSHFSGQRKTHCPSC